MIIQNFESLAVGDKFNLIKDDLKTLVNYSKYNHRAGYNIEVSTIYEKLEESLSPCYKYATNAKAINKGKSERGYIKNETKVVKIDEV